MLSPDLHILRVNPAFCEFIGYPGESLCTMGFADIMASPELVATRQGVELLLRGDIATLHLEKQHKHASGRVVWGAVTIAVVRDVDGAALYLVTQIQDITGRKQAEAENQQLAAQLLQAQKMEALGTLSGGIAHDFNNILAAILGNAELVQDLVHDDPSATEATREITDAAARGSELVRQILTFSRRSERRLKPIRLEAVVDQSLRMLRAALPAAIEIKSELGAAGSTCMGDATQIQQMIANLATNAWHAMEAQGGAVSVSLSRVTVDAEAARRVPELREGPYAVLRVADTGAGIDEETLRHIFEPFFTTKPAGKGTGLGLAVVYGIVHSHGGAIRVESEPGKGTTFEVFLPTVAEQTVALASGAARPRQGNGEHILVVDDEPALVRVLTRQLTLLGYVAHGTTSPEEAPAMLARARFDLALADFNMPRMNGIDLARRLHELRPDLPIFLMSGYSAPVEASVLAGIGVHEVLQKPISQAVLAEKLRLALERSRAAMSPGAP